MAEKQVVVLSAFGKDCTGFVAGITKVLADNKVNIVGLLQTIMQDMFAMIMLLHRSPVHPCPRRKGRG